MTNTTIENNLEEWKQSDKTLFTVKKRLKETNRPLGVSFQTIPSRVTWVPGRQGPKHSGSVEVLTVRTHVEASLVAGAAWKHISL